MMCMNQGHRSQARVLVADWDRSNAQSLASTIHRAGISTAVAFNGKQAVEKAETFRPHLLVTEAYLGRLSGIHAAARISATLPACKVLFLSSEASDVDLARIAPHGLLYSYTPKPIHPLHLLNCIAFLLSADSCTGDWVPTDHAPTKQESHSLPGKQLTPRRRQQAMLPTPDFSRHYFSTPELKREPADMHQ